MRSYFAATFMGIGGIFLAFAGVVFVLEIFARRGNTEHGLAGMTTLGLGFLVAGGILFVLGWVLNRFGRSRENSTTARGNA